MPSHRAGKENVLLLRTCPDVMQDEGRTIRAKPVRHDAHMRQVAGQRLGYDITGQIGDWTLRQWHFGSDPRKQRLQVRHPAMVYAAVWCSKAPERGVGRKIGWHVAVDRKLQVDPPTIAQGADHHIGADPPVGRQVATGNL